MGIRKVLYDIGEIPPVGHIPKKMHAWVIRPDRLGVPVKALQQEIVDVPEIGDDEALILVMAAGINYNGIWACLGNPVSVFDVHNSPFHIPGSDAAGIVWQIGKGKCDFKVGDHVVVHCGQLEANGRQRIWGYETPFGSFAQFTKVKLTQLLKKPDCLSWEESSSYILTLATAYRMLFSHAPNTLRQDSNVLIWGAAGGLGSMATQLVTHFGGNAIGVVGDDAKKEYLTGLGAKGVINRKNFKCWGPLPKTDDKEKYLGYLEEVRLFGRAIKDIIGKENSVDIVVEHTGADTFPVSCYVTKDSGMVVFCGSTTGFNLSFDARFVWMRQKRIQGSHFAVDEEIKHCNELIADRVIKPCLTKIYDWSEIVLAHEKMFNNEPYYGNQAVLVSATGSNKKMGQ